MMWVGVASLLSEAGCAGPAGPSGGVPGKVPPAGPATKPRWKPERTVDDARTVVRSRSRGRCEAIWTDGRCRDEAAQMHHRLARGMGRGRGGHLLERVPQSWAHLCLPCHVRVEAHPQAAQTAGTFAGTGGALRIAGFLFTLPDGRVRYQGADAEYRGEPWLGAGDLR